jgi:gluconolactonase
MTLARDIWDITDERFRSLIPATGTVDMLYDKCRWSEGPVWFSDANQLLWSDIPNNRIMRWTPDGQVSVFRSDSNYSNGNTRDREGRLVTCEHGARRVTRTEHDGSITVIADNYKGKRLNSPNDVVVKSDGSIWFTDPNYGIISDYEGHKSEMEQDGCYVFRVDPKTGKIAIVTDDFDRPNGIAFSHDEKTLYIADSYTEHRHIRSFSVGENSKLKGGKVFAKYSDGGPDGFRVDTDGRLWTSMGAGVNCYLPSGDLLGRLRFPQAVANVEFGGPKRNRLFVACTHQMYVLYVTVNGVLRH